VISNSELAFNINPTVINMLQAHRVVVVIPAFNEERFIGSVVLSILQFPVTVIVVDDGSTDNTVFIANAAGALVLRHEENMGKGKALNTGIREARQMNPEAIVVIDGDGQHLARELPSLVRPILEDGADIVVGSRYLEKTSDVPNHRMLGHWFFNKLTGIASRIKVSDSQSGYRAFSPKAFNTDLFLSTGFSVESEMQFLAHEHGLQVVEIPVTIRYTDKPKRPVMQQGVIVLNGILHLIGQYRPLFFFGLLGLIVMLAGFIFGFIVIDIYRRLTTLAIGYAMISVLFTIIGMVLLSTGIILHSVRGLLIDMLRKNGNADGKNVHTS
jgi:glycosyltransferase involved in cell wall biosynthesis